MSIVEDLMAAELTIATGEAELVEKLKARAELDADIDQLRQALALLKSKPARTVFQPIISVGEDSFIGQVLDVLKDGPLTTNEIIQRLRDKNVSFSKKHPHGTILWAIKKSGRVGRRNDTYFLTDDPALVLRTKTGTGRNAKRNSAVSGK